MYKRNTLRYKRVQANYINVFLFSMILGARLTSVRALPLFLDRGTNEKRNRRFHIEIRFLWMMCVRYVLRRFTHRDSRIFDLLNLIRRECNFSGKYGELYAAFRPCNFYHKFWHRFFASKHAFRDSLSLSLSLPLLSHAAVKIVEILRFSTCVIRYAICRHDLLIGLADRYFTNRLFFKIFPLHLHYLHIQACI